ncbi:VCBS domain-containing protein, partial [Bradyrhizobium sp. KB893862 SZCCT0404]|uniref:beta strand repeat-containing protein n=1 Tax=Bradyrhizobium sp. KB893862 SZCCT0404 TaxID=2807672 RepID=UPI001BA9FF78
TVTAGTPSVGGTLASSDVDHGATATWSGSAAGSYGSFAIGTDGTWTYTLDNTPGSAADQLAEGVVKTETFTATVTDDKGATATETVTVTVTGSNDAPVITSSAQTGSATEDTKLTATGQVTSSDVDHGATAAYSGNATGLYGSFVVDAATGQWTYTLDNANHQDLAAGESHTEIFTVTVTDDKGATATQDVEITVNGTNDNPTLTAGAQSVQLVEAGVGTTGTANASIALTKGDPDTGDAATYDSTALSSNGWATGNGGATYTKAGTYGTATLTTATGVVSYALNDGASATNALAGGAGVSDNFTVFVKDGSTGTASTAVNFAITGTNDNPTLTAGAQSVQLVEAGVGTTGTANASITLTKGDPDTGDAAVFNGTALTSNGWATANSGATYTKTGTYGVATLTTATGVVTYALNNADPDTNALAQGASASDNFTVFVKDGTTGTASTAVNFAITGTNDAPVLNTATWEWGTGNQSKILTISGNLSDPDSGNLTTETVTINWGDNSSVTFNPASSGAFNQTHTYSNSGKFTITLTITDQNGAVITQSTVTSNNGSGSFPAGVAGEPINLALMDPTGERGEVTLVIKGAPSDWTISGGTQNPDGSWTVVTNDVKSLSVTTPETYIGASVLHIVETWVNADGTTSEISIADNVEAYAAGSPIFAWSGDDTLTASSGHDLLVFSQPIGHDTVYSFDVAMDQIDLIGYTSYIDFADVQANTVDDAHGNALITLGDGQTITLNGVHAADLTASNFVFDRTPVTENSGTMAISDGAMLPLSGDINNTGIIELNSSGDVTNLQLIQHGITLEGGGAVVLSDSTGNVIEGTAADVTLTNVDNIISGAGHLGNGFMALINQGSIIATVTNALEIDTGAYTIINSGTLEATGTGGLTIDSAVANSGVLWANGGNITAKADVNGGSALISGSATLELGAASSVDVKFDAAGDGLLQLDQSISFSGLVSGFNSGDQIDLHDILFLSGSAASYTANETGTGGVLSVTDGAHTANIGILGQYTSDNFELTTDESGSSVIRFHGA